MNFPVYDLEWVTQKIKIQMSNCKHNLFREMWTLSLQERYLYIFFLSKKRSLVRHVPKRIPFQTPITLSLQYRCIFLMSKKLRAVQTWNNTHSLLNAHNSNPIGVLSLRLFLVEKTLSCCSGMKQRGLSFKCLSQVLGLRNLCMQRDSVMFQINGQGDIFRLFSQVIFLLHLPWPPYTACRFMQLGLHCRPERLLNLNLHAI